MRRMKDWLTGMKRRTATGPALPGARFVRPAAWTETGKENLDRFLKTPAGAKLLASLHALAG